MRIIKPEIDALNAKYPKQDDAMKKQQEMMALYKKAASIRWEGDIPMLIQLPILIAMFRFFPSSIELRGAVALVGARPVVVRQHPESALRSPSRRPRESVRAAHGALDLRVLLYELSADGLPHSRRWRA